MITGQYITQPDATPAQKQAIAKLCRALGIRDEVEQGPMAQGTAGKLVRELSARVKGGNVRWIP